MANARTKRAPGTPAPHGEPLPGQRGGVDIQGGCLDSAIGPMLTEPTARWRCLPPEQPGAYPHWMARPGPCARSPRWGKGSRDRRRCGSVQTLVGHGAGGRIHHDAGPVNVRRGSTARPVPLEEPRVGEVDGDDPHGPGWIDDHAAGQSGKSVVHRSIGRQNGCGDRALGSPPLFRRHFAQETRPRRHGPGQVGAGRNGLPRGRLVAHTMALHAVREAGHRGRAVLVPSETTRQHLLINPVKYIGRGQCGG